MNKKGFTLIEVIGVVTILAIILLVAVPSLTKTLKRNEQNKYNDYIDNLKIAAENYVVSKLKEGQFFDDDKDYNYISLGELIDAGYIKNTTTNPENNKNLSRDTRVKVSKEADSAFSYDIQEYYNNASDYNKNNLIIHYDAVEYSSDNKFKSLTNEIDYDYSNKGLWTEDGIYMDKTKISTNTKLNNNYETESITISVNLKSLEELTSGGADYTHFLILYNKSNVQTDRLLFRKDAALFYGSGDNTVFTGLSLAANKNFTITFVQEGLTTRKLYINGKLKRTQKNLTCEIIEYKAINIPKQKYDLKMNNILIYNRELSDTEIQELYELDKERFGE